MEPKESSMKKLQKKLYAKQNTIKEQTRKEFSKADVDVAADWQDEQKVTREPQEPVTKKPMTTFTKLLIAAFVFFLVSVGIAFLVFSSNANQVQYDRVGLSILGPNSVPGGEVISFDVMITNDNPVPIQFTDIIITYPAGTYNARLDGELLEKEIRGVEQVLAGTQESEKFNAVFFGTEGETKEIKITYEYRVPDSNAILFEERVYQIKLESSPIAVTIDAPQEVLSGSEVELEIEITSNANKPIDTIYLQVEYPFGFQFNESDPEHERDNQELFKIGTLDVGQSRTIKIIGTVRGQDDEQRVFRYSTGFYDQERQQIVSALQATESVIAIQKPPLTHTAYINNTTRPLHIVEPGEQISLRIDTRNNLGTEILNALITTEITGDIYSEQTITTDGFYNSSRNEFIWQKTDVPELERLDSGADIGVRGALTIANKQSLIGRVDPSINLTYRIEGNTFDFENKKKPVEVSGNTKIRVATILDHGGQVLHSVGPFNNAGPLQPTADTESQYTIVWGISNTTSLVEDATVSAVLPPYVEFLAAETVETGAIEYNNQTRTVTWTIPEIAAGAGYGVAAPVMRFQVAATPSAAQTGQALPLTQQKVVRGFDSFSQTQRQVSDATNDTTDDLVADPAYQFGQGKVK